MNPTPKNIALVKKFIDYCMDELGIDKQNPVSVVLSLQGQQGIPTAGHFNPMNRELVVSIKNRAIADCLRTIAHELTHLRQSEINGVVFPEGDDELQPYEDEANVMSGRLVRFFGRENEEIYSDLG